MMRLSKNNLVLGMLLAGVIGCHYGPQINDLETARRPEGAEVTVHLSGGESKENSLRGELLDVRQDSVLVNVWAEPEKGFASSRVVTQIDYKYIAEVSAGDFGRLEPGNRAEDADRARLRRVSRFPQGLSPELLTELLKAQGQQSLAILGD